jgi:hypothetical protein
VTAWLLFLPGALVVMCCAADTLLRNGSRFETWSQMRTVAATSCRLGVISSVMLALAGLGCLKGHASVLGLVMVVLGLLGATSGVLVSRRYLTETELPRSVRSSESPWLR